VSQKFVSIPKEEEKGKRDSLVKQHCSHFEQKKGSSVYVKNFGDSGEKEKERTLPWQVLPEKKPKAPVRALEKQKRIHS